MHRNKSVESAGVLVSAAELTKTKEEAIREAEKMGYPVVLKGYRRQLAHIKTEAGMVALNINSSEEVAMVFDELMSKAKDRTACLWKRWSGVHGNL